MFDPTGPVTVSEARRRVNAAEDVYLRILLMIGRPPELFKVSRFKALQVLETMFVDDMVCCELRPNGLCILGAQS